MIGGAFFGTDIQAFRIGHMGPQATVENVVSVLVALEGYLRQVGWEVKSGQCLAGVDPELLS
jgi:aspartate aminotransferase-like enzyme